METTTARKLHQYFQDWLGTAAATDQESIDLVEAGLSLKILERLLQRGLSRKEISAVIIRPRTLKHRRSRRAPVSREESERAIRTGRVLAREPEEDRGGACAGRRPRCRGEVATVTASAAGVDLRGRGPGPSSNPQVNSKF